jgi:uncharacterized membrane protein YgcG
MGAHICVALRCDTAAISLLCDACQRSTYFFLPPFFLSVVFLALPHPSPLVGVPQPTPAFSLYPPTQLLIRTFNKRKTGCELDVALQELDADATDDEGDIDMADGVTDELGCVVRPPSSGVLAAVAGPNFASWARAAAAAAAAAAKGGDPNSIRAPFAGVQARDRLRARRRLLRLRWEHDRCQLAFRWDYLQARLRRLSAQHAACVEARQQSQARRLVDKAGGELEAAATAASSAAATATDTDGPPIEGSSDSCPTVAAAAAASLPSGAAALIASSSDEGCARSRGVPLVRRQRRRRLLPLHHGERPPFPPSVAAAAQYQGVDSGTWPHDSDGSKAGTQAGAGDMSAQAQGSTALPQHDLSVAGVRATAARLSRHFHPVLSRTEEMPLVLLKHLAKVRRTVQQLRTGAMPPPGTAGSSSSSSSSSITHASGGGNYSKGGQHVHMAAAAAAAAVTPGGLAPAGGAQTSAATVAAAAALARGEGPAAAVVAAAAAKSDTPAVAQTLQADDSPATPAQDPTAGSESVAAGAGKRRKGGHRQLTGAGLSSSTSSPGANPGDAAGDDEPRSKAARAGSEPHGLGSGIGMGSGIGNGSRRRSSHSGSDSPRPGDDSPLNRSRSGSTSDSPHARPRRTLDIDSVIMPAGFATTRVDLSALEAKEILTPKWSASDIVATMPEGGFATATREQVEAAARAAGVEDLEEDLDAAAYAARHQALEELEQRRYAEFIGEAVPGGGQADHASKAAAANGGVRGAAPQKGSTPPSSSLSQTPADRKSAWSFPGDGAGGRGDATDDNHWDEQKVGVGKLNRSVVEENADNRHPGYSRRTWPLSPTAQRALESDEILPDMEEAGVVRLVRTVAPPNIGVHRVFEKVSGATVDTPSPLKVVFKFSKPSEA